MQEERIAEKLFGDGTHPEMLKRSAPVIIFLSKQNAMTLEIIDWIWKSQQGKHEETVRVVYNLII
jgi:hypothetical protein